MRDEICKCYRTIKILTEKLVEDTKKCKKINKTSEINELLRKIEKRQREWPSIPLTRPEYEKFKSFTEVPQILNVISGLKEIGIKYYKNVDGYSLENISEETIKRKNFCIHDNLTSCYTLRDEIIKRLSTRTKISYKNKNSKHYNLYYENCILPENEPEILRLRTIYREIQDSEPERKKVALRELQKKLKENCKIFVHERIFNDPSFLDKSEFSQMRQFVDKYGLNVSKFGFKSYLNIPIDSSRGRFKNYRTRITDYFEERRNRILNFPEGIFSKPFDFSFGSSDFLNGYSENCPMIWSIYVPNDFTYDGLSYSADLEHNQVHSWYNLKGELYSKPLNDDLDKIFYEEALKTLQIKTEHIQFERPVNNIPSILPTNTPT